MSETDQQPSRVITGLAPRPQFNARTLIKGQRPEQQAPAEEAKPAPAKPARRPAATKSSAATKPAKNPTKAAGSGTQAPMTVYVPTDLRARARAAYRATGHLEGDRSFSNMIEKILEEGIAERERQHNEGRAFAGGSDPLSAGRPLSGD